VPAKDALTERGDIWIALRPFHVRCGAALVAEADLWRERGGAFCWRRLLLLHAALLRCFHCVFSLPACACARRVSLKYCSTARVLFLLLASRLSPCLPYAQSPLCLPVCTRPLYVLYHSPALFAAALFAVLSPP